MLLNKIKEFPTIIRDTEFNKEFKRFISKVKKEYSYELQLTIQIMGEVIRDLTDLEACESRTYKRIKITVDSDFDGFASAKCMYHFLTGLGVPRERIELIPLSSLHRSEEIDVNNCLLVVTDTSYGNVVYKGSKFKVLWIDHHEILFVNYLRARKELGETGLFVNISKSKDREIPGLSCGAFLLIYLNCVIELIGLTPNNQFHIKTELNRTCQLEALLSLISDEREIGEYVGLVKGLYESHTNEFYENFKTRFTYNNHAYFRKYIAKINNLIRMERFDLISDVIKDETDYNTVNEVQRMDEDRDALVYRYLEPAEPLHDFSNENVTIQIYEIPLSQNPVMRNLKGLMAGMKSPDKGNYIIFSGYTRNGVTYLSCRNNVNMNLIRYIKENTEVLEVGGHKPAFGVEIREDKLDDFVRLISKLRDKDLNQDSGSEEYLILKYPELGSGIYDLSCIALYNEFNRKPVKVEFESDVFSHQVVEEKRTVYYLPLPTRESLQVVSFDLEVKDKIIGTPRLKQSIGELGKLDILELK